MTSYLPKAPRYSALTISIAMMTSLAISACGENKSHEKDISKTIPFQSFGKTFKIKPASEATAKERELGRAVVQIQTVEGSLGTGFFISPDGLLLTNHHVIPSSRCPADSCKGIRIIRDFRPNGDIEVFKNIHVMIQSVDRDFTIIKVDLEPGKTVPFLQLDTRLLTNENLSNAKLTVIGHPTGAPMRVTPVNYRGMSEQEIELAGPVFWGNSGSPLIDTDTGRVVGLIAALDIGAHNIDRKGQVSLYPLAIKLNSIVNTTKKLYPHAFTNADGIDLSQLKEINSVSENPFLNSLRPQITSDVLSHETELSMDTFLGHYLDTPRESEGISKLIQSIENRLPAISSLSGFLSVLTTVDLSTGHKFKFTTEQIERVHGLINLTQNKVDLSKLFSILNGTETRQRCLFEIGTDEFINLRALSICQSPVDTKNHDFLDEWQEYRGALFKPEKSELYQEVLKILLTTVNLRLLAGPIDSTHQALALDFLSIIARDTTSLNLSFQVEAKHTLLQRDPRLVGPGAFSWNSDLPVPVIQK
jgi:V8-like Glu-specific endopeptidase